MSTITGYTESSNTLQNQNDHEESGFGSISISAEMLRDIYETNQRQKQDAPPVLLRKNSEMGESTPPTYRKAVYSKTTRRAGQTRRINKSAFAELQKKASKSSLENQLGPTSVASLKVTPSNNRAIKYHVNSERREF